MMYCYKIVPSSDVIFYFFLDFIHFDFIVILHLKCMYAPQIIIRSAFFYTSFSSKSVTSNAFKAERVPLLKFLFRLFPNVDLIVELTHSSNMKFMKFDVPTFSEPTNGISNKESLRNTIKVSDLLCVASR